MKKTPKKSRFRFIRRFIGWVAGLLLFAYALLYTPMVQDRMADYLSETLSQKGLTVELQGLRGIWPFYVSIRSGTVSDTSGKIAEIRRGAVTWRVQDKQIHIHTLKIAELELLRLPVLPEADDAPVPPVQNGSQPWPIGIEIGTFSIDHFILGQSLTGRETEGHLQGTLRLPAQSSLIIASASLEMNEGVADLSLDADLAPFSMEAKLEGSLLRRHEFSTVLQWGAELLHIKTDLDSPDGTELFQFVEERLQLLNPDVPSFLKGVPGLDSQVLPFCLTSTVNLANGTWDLQNQIRFPWGEAEVPLQFVSATNQLTVDVNATASDLSPPGALVEQPLAGAGKVQFSYVSGKDDRKMTLHLASDGFTYGQLKFDSLNLSIDPQETGWEIAGDAQPFLGKELVHVALQCFLEPEADGFSLRSDSLELTTPTWEVKAATPVILRRHQGTYDLSPAEITLNDLPLVIGAQGSLENFRIDLQLPEHPIKNLTLPDPLQVNGDIGASFTLSGSLQAPTAEAHLELKNFRIAYGDIGKALTTHALVDAKWSQESLKVTGNIQDNDQNHFEVTLSSPESWSLLPFSIPWETADFIATCRGKLHLNSLNGLQWLEHQRISGKLNSEIRMERTRQKTNLEGQVQLEDGRYEHYEWGTRLTKIETEVRLEGDRIEIIGLNAQTPGGGNIAGTGKADLQEKGWSSEINLKLTDARILHLDPVKASLSGKVRLKKQPEKLAEVDGSLSLENTVFHMDRLPAPMPKPVPFTIKGSEENLNPPEIPTTTKTKPQQRFRGKIDLDIPGRLIVEAKNLYSVWEGAFNLIFKEDGAYLLGRLSPRRGTVKFFSRSFSLASGNVHFNGKITDSPVLDLEAVYTRQDLEAYLDITGNTTSPDFSLRSNPPFPQDEILSRILFGKDMSTITALQAAEVGMALSSMMDSSGNQRFDPMGKARDILGVDQLELREAGADEGSAELVAGRQINDQLYFEIHQSLNEPGQSILFEYEIKRNFSITTETGTHILPGLGVSWKKDY